MTTKITVDNLAPTLVTTISAGGGPKVSTVIITDASFNEIDDLAANIGGGFVKILGSGFTQGCQVTIGDTLASSVTFISSSELRAQVPGKVSGSYPVYVTNSDGGTGIRINGLSYSAFPVWGTGSSLGSQVFLRYFEINVSANSDSNITYSLAPGSSLPFGANLFANGLITGNVYVENETTFNFVLIATDQENQNTNSSFSLTITPTVFTNATGGTVTEVTESDGITYRVHTFTTSGTFEVSTIDNQANGNAEVLVVAGGGSGGQRHGGGGGAGGMLGPRYINLSEETYTIVVGAGGVNGPSAGARGANSKISLGGSDVLVASGGGAGYAATTSFGPYPAVPGGSGGGAGYGSPAGGLGTPGQGFPGNDFGGSFEFPSTYPGSGGGGAGGQPNKGFSNLGKHGRYSFISGANVAYAGGGGGGYYDSTPPTTLAAGGIGGGGSGYPSGYPGGFPAVAPFANGATNRGGGGGGSGQETAGGSGGSGIVIIKYPITVV
jgi:hypothetical protein